MASKYITQYQQTGVLTVDVDLICKKWNNKFSISVYREKYKLIINGRGKNTYDLKTEISKEQAMLIVDKLDLALVKSGLFSDAGAYHTKEFVESEIKRLRDIYDKKQEEMKFIGDMIYLFERSI